MPVAGTDTVAETLRLFIFMMTLHPEVARRAQRELDKVVGNERLPNMDDRPSLPYIDNIIKELMRIAPIGPVGFDFTPRFTLLLLTYII